MSKPLSQADLEKLALSQLGSRTNKLMGTSSKINKFLTGKFDVPARISDLEKWSTEQKLGIANKELLSAITTEAINRDIKKEVSRAIQELKVSVLTPEQEAKIPDAILSYERFLESYVKQMKSVNKLVSPANATKQEVKVNAKVETA